MKRVFLTVLDSFGIGQMPDSRLYGDEGANTLKSCCETGLLNVPNMKNMGLFNIDGVECAEGTPVPTASFCRAAEKSKGKDTTTGHWEISGIVTNTPFKTYPDGFPDSSSGVRGRWVGKYGWYIPERRSRPLP